VNDPIIFTSILSRAEAELFSNNAKADYLIKNHYTEVTLIESFFVDQLDTGIQNTSRQVLLHRLLRKE
jgi:hypothetical protein